MRKSVLAASVLACFLALPAAAQLSITIGAPVVHIGVNLPVYPTLQRIPGYPVYYAPSVDSNYFFYDGLYWVYNDDHWYSSSWYNGPWVFVQPVYVPQPLLVIPFRYYRVRPVYWGGWGYDAPPRWGQHWGRDWESHRTGWDRWDRNRAPAAAPLPTYQRSYPRDRYPAPAQQVIIHNEHYTYQARDAQVQQERATIFRQQSAGGTKATVKAERVEHPEAAPPTRERQQRQEATPPPARSQRPETTQPPAAPRQDGPAVERGQPERGRRSEPQRAEPQPNAPREQAAPQQAPRRERPQEAVPPPAAPRLESQPNAPREQAGPQQAPRGERPPARQPEERQREKGPEGRSEEAPGQNRK